MAVHRESVPPRSLAEWQRWEDTAIVSGNRRWLPGDEIRIKWPEGFVIEVAPGWIPLAEDHPFKGRVFCWRCLAEASGFATGDAPHKRDAVCWGPPSGDTDAEDPDPDTGEAFRLATIDQTSVGPVHEPPWVIGPDGRHQYAETAAADEQPEPSPADRDEALRRCAAGLGLPEDIVSPPEPGTERWRRGYDTGTFFYDGPTPGSARP